MVTVQLLSWLGSYPEPLERIATRSTDSARICVSCSCAAELPITKWSLSSEPDSSRSRRYMGFGVQGDGHSSRPLEKEASDRVHAGDCAACPLMIAVWGAVLNRRQSARAALARPGC